MATATVEAVRTGYHELAIADIRESGTNPRRRFDKASLAELAASIRQLGILEPLIVRIAGDGFELVAGERRLRAAREAGLQIAPCVIRILTDREALEVQLVENLQREDVHPLDESDGYAALMNADPAYTVEAVAARFGKSSSYVYQRLKLKNLTEDARDAFEADEITAAHAVRLARLPTSQQKSALRECFHSMFDDRKGERKPAPVALLDRWIADHTAVDPSQREDLQHYLPELAQQLEAETEPATLLQLSASSMPGFYLGTKTHGLLGQGRWKEVKSAKACAHVQRGVIVHGGPLRVLNVCAKKGCPKHWPIEKKAKATTKQSQPKYDYEAERAKDDAARKRFALMEPIVMSALAKTYADVALDDALLRRVVESFDREAESAILGAGLRIAVKHAGAILAFLIDTPNFWNIEQLKRQCKARKVDFKAIDKEIDDDESKAKPETKAPAKKAATKKKAR